MNTLIIYDTTGYILSTASGSVREPIGIPFIWATIPEGQQIKYTDGIGVDITVTPNIAILEDIPKTDMGKLQSENASMLMALVMGGLM